MILPVDIRTCAPLSGRTHRRARPPGRERPDWFASVASTKLPRVSPIFRNSPPEESSELETVLDACAAALDDEKFEEALEAAEQALALSPTHIDALHFRATALTGLGELEQAHEAYAAALRQAPNDLDLLHGAAELLIYEFADDHDALDDALELLERALKRARKLGEEDRLPDLLLLAAMALNKAGAPDRALKTVEESLALDPENLDALLERGIALFELCRFEEARKQFLEIIERDDHSGWPHHYLGLIAERLGDHDEAMRRFERACALSPDDLAPAVELSHEAFDKAVEDALARMPEKVRRYLSNVSIAVEEIPSDDDLKASDPPLSPCILGLFRGTPITEASHSDPWSHFPSAILLYQRNLQRFARTREELIEQIGITLIHEAGHFLGLSEEDLYERGLD